MIYLLHPEAESDLRDAASFYQERAGMELAQSFLGEFEYFARLLLQHPLLGAPWRKGKRRLLMKHFPYTISYMAVDQEIRILAIAHQSRRPAFWKNRKW